MLRHRLSLAALHLAPWRTQRDCLDFHHGLLGAGAVTLLEALHSSGGVNQFLLPGKEWMTGATNLESKPTINRVSLECVAAGTDHGY